VAAGTLHGEAQYWQSRKAISLKHLYVIHSYSAKKKQISRNCNFVAFDFAQTIIFASFFMKTKNFNN
jgi:hypothetical protein